MVESSVKTISRLVINRLRVDVNQLDEVACRQLDRVCRSSRSFILRSTTIAKKKKTDGFWFHMENFVYKCAVSLT